MKGVIVENSLKDKNIIDDSLIIRAWEDDGWKLYEVKVTREWAEKIGEYLNDGPWYVHFWDEGSDDVLVVFKDRKFWIKHSKRETWVYVLDYGKSIGIPDEQLDFLINQ